MVYRSSLASLLHLNRCCDVLPRMKETSKYLKKRMGDYSDEIKNVLGRVPSEVEFCVGGVTSGFGIFGFFYHLANNITNRIATDNNALVPWLYVSASGLVLIIHAAYRLGEEVSRLEKKNEILEKELVKNL